MYTGTFSFSLCLFSAIILTTFLFLVHAAAERTFIMRLRRGKKRIKRQTTFFGGGRGQI